MKRFVVVALSVERLVIVEDALFAMMPPVKVKSPEAVSA